MSKRLVGKVALVTGGSSGLGLATAHRFASEGAKVFITGRRKDELDHAVEHFGHGVVGVQGDISSMADLDRLYEVIKQQAGRLDVLFANAGGGEFSPLGQITEAHVDQLDTARFPFDISADQSRRGPRGDQECLAQGARLVADCNAQTSRHRAYSSVDHVSTVGSAAKVVRRRPRGCNACN